MALYLTFWSARCALCTLIYHLFCSVLCFPQKSVYPFQLTMSLQRFLNISSRCSRRSFASKAQASTSLDGGEVHTFSRLSSEWHEEGGPFKALHSLNALRVPWILRNIDKKTGSVADVGCGGGLLSVPLARAGFKVTGIDATKEAVGTGLGRALE